jgi:Ca2+/Na+ antiporter
MANNWANRYIEYIGFVKDEYPVKKEIYQIATSDSFAQKHLQYLNELNKTHENRQLTIENKNSQIIGQSSIVISIVALFIPLIITNLSDLSLWVRVLLIILFILLLAHFALAIFHATKTLEADKNRYMTGATSSVTKATRAATEEKFTEMQIQDLVHIVNFNNAVTNRTAANLVYASRCFKTGNIGFAIFSCLLISLSTIITKEPEKVNVVNLGENAGRKYDSLLIEHAHSKSDIYEMREGMTDLSKKVSNLRQQIDSTSATLRK